MGTAGSQAAWLPQLGLPAPRDGEVVLASGLCQVSPPPRMQYQLGHGASAEGPWGACVCPHRSWVSRGALSALALWLVSGKPPFRINVFQMRPLHAVCLLRSVCLSVQLCRKPAPWGTAASMPPPPGTLPWEAASFSPLLWGSRTEPRGAGMSGCQTDGCL